MLKLGAHLSIAGGYHKAIEQIVKIGGNCLQIFSTSPRSWSFAKVDEEQILQFFRLKSQLKIDPVYFHASYLINLANKEKIGHLSKLSLISELSIAPKLGIKGSVVHLGSFKDKISQTHNVYHKALHINYETLIRNIKEILDKTPKDSLFIIENAGNRKIGKSLEEMATIIKDINNHRLRICLDTCHLYSSGYDLSTKDKLEQFIDFFDSLIGLEKLELFHFNDSKDPFNSGRDRHENIGNGTVPITTFKLIMTHNKLKYLPFIIETPGFDKQGPDKRNLDILKSLVSI